MAARESFFLTFVRGGQARAHSFGVTSFIPKASSTQPSIFYQSVLRLVTKVAIKVDVQVVYKQCHVSIFTKICRAKLGCTLQRECWPVSSKVDCIGEMIQQADLKTP
mmetsp:Transcript_7144/g.10448  ORF Transcript_7144/g.10448 Transcript_7144/m.10448 type:complete len:107 (+) Transcript_7144:166-486(+)